MLQIFIKKTERGNVSSFKKYQPSLNKAFVIGIKFLILFKNRIFFFFELTLIEVDNEE